jgi:nucleoside triphosphate diphosphatase
MAAPPPDPDAHPFDALVQVMSTLRDPVHGCPWDREQDLQSLKAYAVEEVYELLDAIDAGVPDDHRDELGDVLLQIVFQARIRDEAGEFDAYDVCRAITAKMLRRHPHVFGDETVDSAEDSRASWERIKAEERAGKPKPGSALDGVPRSMPALLRASRLGEKAAAVGFDWQASADVMHKIREEVDELQEALAESDRDAAAREFGDVLLALTSLGRHLDIEPEDALRGANDRFTARFQNMEERALGPLSDLDPAALEDLWQRAKAELES